jgi:tetratricopeptide (TPR) repeat protein
MYCPNCGTQNQEDAAFCMACGSPLASPPTRGAETEPLPPAARYCTRCGLPLADLRSQDVYCGRCGAPLVAPSAADRRRKILRYALPAAAVAALLLMIAGGVLAGHTWRDARALRSHYDAGLAALADGDPDQAVAELGWVVARAPDYKDTAAWLASAREEAGLAALYAQAETSCQERRWQQALETLEDLHARAPGYKTQGVADLLFTAHYQAGVELAAAGSFDEALPHLDEALALRPGEAVEKQKQLAGLTLEGLACLERSDPFGARDALRAAVNLEPTYPQAAAGLYRAHVQCCDALAGQGRLDAAEAECLAAQRLQPGGQEATGGLARIAFLRTPSPTPTPTPTPTWTPSPTPEATPTPEPSPTPTETPKPRAAAAPKCRSAAKGLIGFKRQSRCNARTGDGCGAVTIWVMNADGTGQAPMCNPQAYTKGLVLDRTHADGWRVEVRGRGVDIARIYPGGREEMIIVNNRKDWDPVLSADGWWLAWVTNRNANDEIYIKTMDPKDQNQRRLTVNNWEWDKHPTWSPDGRRIAFYSNRADKLNEATRQIWIMEVVNDQGVNLRNVSNRPDMVDIDPVWFKWDVQ